MQDGTALFVNYLSCSETDTDRDGCGMESVRQSFIGRLKRDFQLIVS